MLSQKELQGKWKSKSYTLVSILSALFSRYVNITSSRGTITCLTLKIHFSLNTKPETGSLRSKFHEPHLVKTDNVAQMIHYKMLLNGYFSYFLSLLKPMRSATRTHNTKGTCNSLIPQSKPAGGAQQTANNGLAAVESYELRPSQLPNQMARLPSETMTSLPQHLTTNMSEISSQGSFC